MSIIRPYNRSYCTHGGKDGAEVLQWCAICAQHSDDDGDRRLTWLGNFNNLLLPTMLLLYAIDIIYYHFLWPARRPFVYYYMDVLHPTFYRRRRRKGRTWSKARIEKECARSWTRKRGPWWIIVGYIFCIILVTLSQSIIIIIISADYTTHWQDDARPKRDAMSNGEEGGSDNRSSCIAIRRHR